MVVSYKKGSLTFKTRKLLAIRKKYQLFLDGVMYYLAEMVVLYQIGIIYERFKYFFAIKLYVEDQLLELNQITFGGYLVQKYEGGGNQFRQFFMFRLRFRLIVMSSGGKDLLFSFTFFQQNSFCDIYISRYVFRFNLRIVGGMIGRVN
eukprot:TRINITY_DN1681_c0_g1_i6.p4 TRINITY_DN1681_c0_g1~~TRINITY_DN1681_c0_g1_i6.p4  ORF type:complete len:148 (-),score=2.65 TRINITY_DN1681_c0_g1_i6:282-725(-)